MIVPGFYAEASLYGIGRSMRQGQLVVSPADTVVPAIPSCGNCDVILDHCARDGWRPRAVCNACAIGDCYSGVEVPPPTAPFLGSPQW